LIDKNRVAAIKELIKREKIFQKDLAEMLGIEPQNLSRIIHSERVTDKTCRKIASLFPYYRIEWIYGIDPWPTIAEKEVAEDGAYNAANTIMDRVFKDRKNKKNNGMPAAKSAHEIEELIISLISEICEKENRDPDSFYLDYEAFSLLVATAHDSVRALVTQFINQDSRQQDTMKIIKSASILIGG